MVNDLIIIRLKNVNENKKNKLLTYLKHNSLSYIELNKNTFQFKNQDYHFCCNGCRKIFIKKPKKWKKRAK